MLLFLFLCTQQEYARLLAAREGYGVGGLGPDDIRQMEDGDGIFRPDSHSMRENVMVRVNILRGASPAHNRRTFPCI